MRFQVILISVTTCLLSLLPLRVACADAALDAALQDLTPEDLLQNATLPAVPAATVVPTDSEQKTWLDYLKLYLPDVIIVVGAVVAIETILWLARHRAKTNH